MDALEQSEMFTHDGVEHMVKRCRDDNAIKIRCVQIGRDWRILVTRGDLNVEVFSSTRKTDAISEWNKWS